jgi:hypothetical protein
MGHRYYATVTFPAAAGKIPEVRAWLDGDEKEYYDIDDDGELIDVSADERNWGKIEFTDILDQHRVPYDHYHGDDMEGRSTVYVRWPVGAERVAGKLLAEPDKAVVKLGEVDGAIAEKAKRLLEVWNEGGPDAVRAELESLKAQLPEPLNLDWKPA